MHLAEDGEAVLRPEHERADAAGMIPGGALRDRLQPVERRAGGGEHGERVGLGVEHVDGARRAASQWRGRVDAAAHAGRR